MGEFTDKAQGKVRELKGKATGDPVEETKGKAQQVKGQAEGVVNRVSDKAGAEANRTDPASRADTRP